MDLLTKQDLEQLGARRNGRHISFYMPTHRAGAEIQQDPIRLKNLIAQAEEELTGAGVRLPEAQGLLEPAAGLLEDQIFWQHQSDGLALFLDAGTFSTFRLPLDFKERVVVGPQFYIKPLLPLLSGDGQFLILALSQDDVRLLQGTRYRVAEVDLAGVPTSLARALRFDDPEGRLQFHTTTGPSGGQGARPAAFHGTGAPGDDEKDDILRYFQKLDRGLQDLLAGQRLPLVLAGVDYLLPLYREASAYDHILAEGIEGNPQDLPARELHRRAWAIVQPIFEQAQREAADRYRQAAGGESASAELEEIVPAAHFGRVDTLFVALDEERWGAFDAQTNQLDVHQAKKVGDQDLFDLAAVQTLLNGGTVFAVPADKVPDGGLAAALLRY